MSEGRFTSVVMYSIWTGGIKVFQTQNQELHRKVLQFCEEGHVSPDRPPRDIARFIQQWIDITGASLAYDRAATKKVSYLNG